MQRDKAHGPYCRLRPPMLHGMFGNKHVVGEALPKAQLLPGKSHETRFQDETSKLLSLATIKFECISKVCVNANLPCTPRLRVLCICDAQITELKRLGRSLASQHTGHQHNFSTAPVKHTCTQAPTPLCSGLPSQQHSHPAQPAASMRTVAIERCPLWFTRPAMPW